MQNESPAILANSAVWATHMGVSSNVRYQLLNGLDMVRLRLLSLISSPLRSLHCGFHDRCYLRDCFIITHNKVRLLLH